MHALAAEPRGHGGYIIISLDTFSACPMTIVLYARPETMLASFIDHRRLGSILCVKMVSWAPSFSEIITQSL